MTCFVHIGTHKTGTTSVQRTFAANDRAFAEAGTYFARSGRPDAASGHHNIAWQLNSDRRFDPAAGTLDELLAELAAQRHPRALISSEDFEYLYADPERLRPLERGLRAIGYRAVVVVYLRPQAGYAESLYAELVKSGLGLPFDAFLANVLTCGEVCHQQRWRFTFDYERLIDGFAAVFGRPNVVVRSYDDVDRDVVVDFCRAIGADAALRSGRIVTPGRLNTALSFADVVQRFEINAARLRGEGEAAQSRRVKVSGRFDPVHLPQVRQIVERFNAGNARVHQRYGALVPCVSGRDLVADFGASAGLDPASRRRRRLLDARSRLHDPDVRRCASPGVDVRAAAFTLAAAARSEAVVVSTAIAATLVLLLLGWQSARTAFVEFGMLSFLFALSVAGRVARRAAEANGILLDRRFFDAWGARLRLAGYSLVAFYAVTNALLDIGVPRLNPDVLSLPGALATAAAALIVSIVLAMRREAGSTLCDGRAYIAIGVVVLVLEAAHAATPVWWLDTALDMLLVAFAGARLGQIVRSSPAFRILDEPAVPARLRAASTRPTRW